MNTPEDLLAIDVERVKAENRVEEMLVALAGRVKAHRDSAMRARERIARCRALWQRAPAHRDVLDPTIEIWSKDLRHHEEVVASCEHALVALIPATCPHGYRHSDLKTGASVCEVCKP